MDEVWVRLIVVAAAVAVAGLWAVVTRRGIAFRRRPIELPAGPGLILFTSRTCESCGRARAVLDEIGVDYREVAYEEEPGLFGAGKVDRVPAVARLEPDGTGWIAAGVPVRSRIRRWLGDGSS